MTMTSTELPQTAREPAWEKEVKHVEEIGGFRSTQVYIVTSFFSFIEFKSL
jgi:hypothetical protein